MLCFHTQGQSARVSPANHYVNFYFFLLCLASSPSMNITLEGQYHCNNGPKIPLDKLCDFSTDCPLGDDEGNVCREYTLHTSRCPFCVCFFFFFLDKNSAREVGQLWWASFNEAVASCSAEQQRSVFMSFSWKRSAGKGQEKKSQLGEHFSPLTYSVAVISISLHICFVLFSRPRRNTTKLCWHLIHKWSPPGLAVCVCLCACESRGSFFSPTWMYLCCFCDL